MTGYLLAAMAENFTHRAYRDLLAEFVRRGYSAKTYETVSVNERDLIVRHDLDMSLQAAEPIAEIEHSLGISATYFVLLRTEMYNPFSDAGLRSLNTIASLGHAIGLHLDGSLYGNDISALDAAAEHECKILEGIIEAPVRYVSFHRPSKALLGYDQKIAGRYHAYEPRFFSEMGYVSDSRGGWHNGHPLEHDSVSEGGALQMLTHPVWWRTKNPGGAEETLDLFLEERGGVLAHELAANCEPYRILMDKRGRS